MTKQNIENVIITVDDQHMADVESVAAALRAAGMSVTNVMPTTGIITGGVASDTRQSLSALPGVKAIEPDEEMRAI